MEKLKNANRIIYIIVAILILIGAIILGVKGFNIELFYSSRQEMNISNNTGLDSSKVFEIAKEVLGDQKIKVQEVERFGNAVQIISTEISDESKQEIVNKVNEEYSTDISADDVEVINIPNTRIRDILKPYILPGVITFAIILIYFAIAYKKQGLREVLLKGIFIPIITELTYYAVIAITRIPFGRVTNSIAIGLYVASIGILTIYFQRKKDELTKNENEEK